MMMRASSSARRLLGALAGAAVWLGAGAAWAEPADDLVRVLHYDAYYDSVSTAALALAKGHLKERGLTDAKLAEASAKLDQTAADYKTTFLEQIAQSYSKRFTPEELKQLADFYATTAGQKFTGAQRGVQDDVALATRNAGVFIGVAAAQLVK